MSSKEKRNIPVEGPFILHREGYSVCYDGARKNPLWVYECLTPESVSGRVKREDGFTEDKDLPVHLRSTLGDYRGSGYDRGHLAACANHCSSRSTMLETFLLSNMSPQVGKGFNRGAWRNLEERVRKIAEKSISVQVVSGPLYLPNDTSSGREVRYLVIGKGDVAVPSHFYKVIFTEFKPGKFKREAYILPNEETAKERSLDDYQVTVGKVESLAGVVFKF